MAVKREQVVQTAEKYVARGKIEPAIREYRKLLEENPNDINTLNRVGDLYARIQRIDEAVDFFNQIAEQYAGEGFFVKAIAIYKKIIKLDPTRLDVYESLAELYHRQGLVTEARTQYQVLADYYQKHENATSTIAIYQKMAELEPNNPTYHVKLAELYQQQQLIDKAMGEYRIIAELMIEHGHPQEAGQVYERALAIDSSNLGFISDAALKLKTAAGPAVAARFLAAAVERNPQALQVARLVGGAAGLGGTYSGVAAAGAPVLQPAAPAAPPEPQRQPGDETAVRQAPRPSRSPAAAPPPAPAAAPAAPPPPGRDARAYVDHDSRFEEQDSALPAPAAMAGAAAMPGLDGADMDVDFEEIEIDLGADLILDEELGASPAGSSLPPLASDDSYSAVGGLAADSALDAAFEIDEEAAPPSLPYTRRPGGDAPHAGQPVDARDADAYGAGARAGETQGAGAAADHGAADLDDVFVLDIEDDEEPASLVKPPPDMLREPRRPSWAQGATPAAAAPPPAATPKAPAPRPSAAGLEGAAGAHPAPAAAAGAPAHGGSLPAADADADFSLLELPDLGDLPDLADLDVAASPFGSMAPDAFDLPAPAAGPGPVAAGPPPSGQLLSPLPEDMEQALSPMAGDAGDTGDTGEQAAMTPAAAGEPPFASPAIEIDSDLLERTAAELLPQTTERYEDLVSEAEVLAKYGLEEKAAERLRDAIRIKPRHVAAYLLLIQLQLDKGRHGRVIELANQVAELTAQSSDRETWPKLRKRLLAAGYRIDGDRVAASPRSAAAADSQAAAAPSPAAPPAAAVVPDEVAPPLAAAAPPVAPVAPPGAAGAGRPGQRPRAVAAAGLEQMLESLMAPRAKRPPKPSAAAAPAAPEAPALGSGVADIAGIADVAADPAQAAAPAAAGAGAAAPSGAAAGEPAPQQPTAAFLAEAAALLGAGEAAAPHAPASMAPGGFAAGGPAHDGSLPAGALADDDGIELAPLQPLQPLQPQQSAEAGAEPAGDGLPIFNPLEIGAMVESEEIDWDDGRPMPGFGQGQPPAGGFAPPPPAPAPAAGASGAMAAIGAIGASEPPSAPPPSSAPPAAVPAAAVGAADAPAADAAGSAALDDTGMSWLDEADSGKDRLAARAASLFDDEADFFDLAGELEQELSQEPVFQGEDLLVQQEQSLEEIVEGFKRGVAEHLSPTDYDTHFNLGIAYREMGLLDEAIGEFQVSAKDARYLVSCCSMLGLCFLDKGLPELAIKWYRRGMEASGISEEDTLGLLYDMGCAYLAMGDNAGAYKTFVDVYGINTNYRDVVARIEELGHPH